ncbi:hypothetical protein MPER_14993, partial [Moniliophthora perniciosa FA553]
YELERRHYAKQLIDFDKKFAKLFSGKPRSELNMDGVSHEEFLQCVLWFPYTSDLLPPAIIRAFQTFGGFTSGIGVHYEDSAIVDARNQALAANLTVGERVPPQALLRAADSRPFNIQDLLPSNTRFKILVFTGDSSDAKQLAKVQSLAERLQAPDSFLVKGSAKNMTEFISISSTKKNVVYNVIPLLFRSHWS